MMLSGQIARCVGRKSSSVGCGALLRTWQRSLKSLNLSALPDKVTFTTCYEKPTRISVEDKLPLDFLSTVELTQHNTQYWTESQKPRTIFISRKETARTLQILVDMCNWIHTHYPDAIMIIETGNASGFNPPSNLPVYEFPSAQRSELTRVVDFVICLGGDGSILRVSSLFGSHPAPPILGLSLGTMNFLAPFHPKEWQKPLQAVFTGGFHFVNRMRLQCFLEFQNKPEIPLLAGDHPWLEPVQNYDGAYEYKVSVLNEVEIRREKGKMLDLDLYVNNQFFTEASGDGLLFSTATGSTAYSLSCGGSMVHPRIKSILLTPISPRSLAFRSLILPWDVVVETRITTSTSPLKTTTATLTFDGFPPVPFSGADKLTVCKSPYPLPTITKKDVLGDWTHDIRTKLNWNILPPH